MVISLPHNMQDLPDLKDLRDQYTYVVIGITDLVERVEVMTLDERQYGPGTLSESIVKKSKQYVYDKGTGEVLLDMKNRPYFYDEKGVACSLWGVDEVYDETFPKVDIYENTKLVMPKQYFLSRDRQYTSDIPFSHRTKTIVNLIKSLIVGHLQDSVSHVVNNTTNNGVVKHVEDAIDIIKQASIFDYINNFIADVETQMMYVEDNDHNNNIVIKKGVDYRIYNYTKMLEDHVINELTANWLIVEKGKYGEDIECTFEMYVNRNNLNVFHTFNKLQNSTNKTNLFLLKYGE